ncbi:MAG: archaeal proteasome endopeptidase complex subunit alpha [Candidatus Diapherotrites archaeon]|nr:archaeal proteasome endopeptidase complex subunit alpha [Candidatus Diapherotrites archaeon]
MYPASSTAYDRAITVFSPDGRLFQVEYAREAVKRGTTALGLVYKDGGILATDKSTAGKLVKAESIEKIFKIDDHIGAATSGLVADARRIIHHARVEAQRERVAYNSPVNVETLTKEICDLKQMYTQYGGTRPFGTALLVVGIDDNGARLFETDPSGAFFEVYASAIGSGKKEVEAIFEKEHDADADFASAVKLMYKALKAVGDKNTSYETISVYFIDRKDKQFKKLSTEEFKKLASKGGK